MGKILAITNQKGGVGKTTTSVNLAASLAATKKSILLVDLDPQGNATSGCGIDKHETKHTVYDVLVGEASAEKAVSKTVVERLFIIPANDDLTAAEVELLSIDDNHDRLKTELFKIRDQYDFILIDCPPSLNMLTVNALTAADEAIIPIQCEYYALEGLTALLNTIDKIQGAVNNDLEIGGLLRTMFDPRNSLANDVSGQLIDHFGDKVFRTIVPRNVRLAEAPSHGLPIIQYDEKSRGALAYLALAGELIRREEEKQQSQQNEVEATHG